MTGHKAAAQQQRGVIRQGADRKAGEKTEGAIEQPDDATGEISGKRIPGNGELRDHPLRARAKMRKHRIEELLQLMRIEAVEKEVGNDQIIASGGVPLESIGVMQTNASACLGA